MLKRLLFLVTLCLPFTGLAQCTTTNATSCQCLTPGSTNCDLLPDIIAARPPLLVSGTSGVIEYSQTGNGAENGRLRISVSTPNIGRGPLEIRTTSTYICGTDTITGTAPTTCPNTGLPPRQLIKQRIYHKTGSAMSYYDRDAGSMTYHPTHGHMHVDDWGVFTLRTQSNDPNPLNWPIVGNGAKLAFCLMDYGSCSTYNGHCVDSLGNTLTSTNFPNFGLGGGSYNCSPTVQGISSGYTDIYYQSLSGMYITIPPGTCNGQYYIVVQLDPYNYFLEEKETNNVIVVPYTLTQQGGITPTVTASGSTTICTGGSVILTSSTASSYLWSNGDTTQSISVSQQGVYTVTTNPTSACPIASAPMSVTELQMPVTALVTDSMICSGETVSLNATVTNPPTTVVQTTFSNNNTYAIPDNNPNGVYSPITVSGINPSTLSTGIVVYATVNITHTYDGDLVLYLISPSGTSVMLSNRRGGSGDNFTNTVFTMSANTSISAGAAPFNGNFIPDGNISNYTGNANGTWQLRAVDAAGTDVGNITSWTLTLKNTVPSSLQYTWSSNPTGFSANTASTNISPSASGTYLVHVTDAANGCSGSDSVFVQVDATPSAPYPLNGPALACVGTTLNYYVNNNPNISYYNWTVPAGTTIVSGQGTNSIQVSFSSSFTSGTVCVTAQRGDCVSPPRCKTVTKHTAIRPGLIQGELSGHCMTSSAAVSVVPVSYAVSYQWTPPSGMTVTSGQGTNAITFSTASGFTSGSLCVTSNNGCMNSTSRCATVYATPAKPTITGPTSVCANQTNVAYTSTTSAGATYYKWTGPIGSSISGGQGTTAAVLNFGSTAGNVSCAAKNACGIRGTTYYAVAMPCRIEDSITSLEVDVQPNPTSGITMLELTGGAMLNTRVTLYDLLGREKMQKEMDPSVSRQVSLDLTSFPKGIYLLEVNNGAEIKSLRVVVE
ncbi:MAG: proprotein convertase P-domain-containing protein [Bacteroidota bacterium]